MQRIKSVSPHVFSLARYALAISLISAAAFQTTRYIVSDIIAAEQLEAADARELSRVELVMRAHHAAYVHIPPHDEKTSAVSEPHLVASNLAGEIDSAELADTPRPVNAVQTGSIARTVTSAEMTGDHSDGRPKPSRKPQRITTLKKLRLGSSDPQKTQAATVALTPLPESGLSLKAVVQAEIQPKSDPARKKLARRLPNAGELVRMQLQNLI